MTVIKTTLNSVYLIQNKNFEDHRGFFVKTFHKDVFEANSLETDFRESFYSVSKKNVLRGMHFQLLPHDHAKLVYVTSGEILDVAVDIRKDSPIFGHCYSATLSDANGHSLYMDKGFAHGFLTLSETATVVYMTTTVHSPEYDAGIRWDGFGFDWKIDSPVISERDNNLVNLQSIKVL